MALGQAYGDAATFLSLGDYKHFNRWVDEVAARPAVQRGRRVNRKLEKIRASSASGTAPPISTSGLRRLRAPLARPIAPDATQSSSVQYGGVVAHCE